jgi:hypothetical protein
MSPPGGTELTSRGQRPQDSVCFDGAVKSGLEVDLTSELTAKGRYLSLNSDTSDGAVCCVCVRNI